MEIPLSEIHPFENHPFKVTDDDHMLDMAESIREHGVLVPGLVRPREEGGYEMVAGHRRHRASELAERDTMPVMGSGFQELVSGSIGHDIFAVAG